MFYRSVAMMKPNSRKIAEVYLAAKGFTNSKVTTHAAHSTGTAEWKTRDPDGGYSPAGNRVLVSRNSSNQKRFPN